MGRGITEGAPAGMRPVKENAGPPMMTAGRASGKRSNRFDPTKHGTLATIVSAACALIFGLATVSISYQISRIQKTIAEESARDRDVAALRGYVDTTLRNYAIYTKGNMCIDAVLWMAQHRRDTFDTKFTYPYDLFDDTLLDDAIGDRGIERKRLKCRDDDGEGASFLFAAPFNMIEVALLGWRSAMSPERKALYRQQLDALICDEAASAHVIVTRDFGPLSRRMRQAYPQIHAFVAECGKPGTAPPADR
ncbi:MAG: hypothetical protein PGN34_04025 [Methylobacterium frigidaeris]